MASNESKNNISFAPLPVGDDESGNSEDPYLEHFQQEQQQDPYLEHFQQEHQPTAAPSAQQAQVSHPHLPHNPLTDIQQQ